MPAHSARWGPLGRRAPRRRGGRPEQHDRRGAVRRWPGGPPPCRRTHPGGGADQAAEVEEAGLAGHDAPSGSPAPPATARASARSPGRRSRRPGGPGPRSARATAAQPVGGPPPGGAGRPRVEDRGAAAPAGSRAGRQVQVEPRVGGMPWAARRRHQRATSCSSAATAGPSVVAGTSGWAKAMRRRGGRPAGARWLWGPRPWRFTARSARSRRRRSGAQRAVAPRRRPHPRRGPAGPAPPARPARGVLAGRRRQGPQRRHRRQQVAQPERAQDDERSARPGASGSRPRRLRRAGTTSSLISQPGGWPSGEHDGSATSSGQSAASGPAACNAPPGRRRTPSASRPGSPTSRRRGRLSRP